MLILKERASNICLQSEREITMTTDTKDSLLADHHLTNSHAQFCMKAPSLYKKYTKFV